MYCTFYRCGGVFLEDQRWDVCKCNGFRNNIILLENYSDYGPEVRLALAPAMSLLLYIVILTLIITPSKSIELLSLQKSGPIICISPALKVCTAALRFGHECSLIGETVKYKMNG